MAINNSHITGSGCKGWMIMAGLSYMSLQGEVVDSSLCSSGVVLLYISLQHTWNLPTTQILRRVLHLAVLELKSEHWNTQLNAPWDLDIPSLLPCSFKLSKTHKMGTILCLYERNPDVTGIKNKHWAQREGVPQISHLE